MCYSLLTLPANAEGGTRQVSQEFPCNPEASLPVRPSGLQEGEIAKGSLATLACCSAAWGLSSAEPSGGHQPRVLQASTAARGQQQSLHASISAQQCTDHLLMFLQYIYLSVRSYSIHSTSQKGIRASQSLNADVKIGFMQGDLSLSGNSGIMCFVASLDLPVSFCSPKSFGFFFFPTVIFFSPVFIKCRLFAGHVPPTPAVHSSVPVLPPSLTQLSLRQFCRAKLL